MTDNGDSQARLMVTELLGIFVNVLTPVFILVGLGYVAATRLDIEGRTLSRVAFYVLTPAFVFNILSGAKIEAALAVRMIGYITVVYVGSIAVALLVARLLRRDAKMTAAYVMLAAFGNVGNFGLPISTFAEGQPALVPATVYFLANLVLAFIVCVTAASAANAVTSHRGKVDVSDAFRRVVTTPGLIALVPALLFNALDVKLPLAATRPLELLSGALIPVMLLVLGVQIAQAGVLRPNRDTWVAIGIRLITGPVLGFALLGAFGLSGLEANVGVLQASMPTAVLVSIIALETKMLPEFITPTVLISNLFSIATLAVVIALLPGSI